MPDLDWGTVTLGRFAVRETFALSDAMNANTGVRAVKLAGQESLPPLTVTELDQRREDLSNLMGLTIPVVFSVKNEFSGWYTVTDVGVDTTNYTGEVEKADWNLTLDRLGQEGQVDMDSRVVWTLRSNALGVTGERWHAPAGGALGYYTGSSQPSGSISRASADGTAVVVYRGVPAGVAPRWTVTPAQAGQGRARVLLNSVERTGRDLRTASASAAWEVQNGIIRVRPGTGNTLDVAVWDGAAWDTAGFNVSSTASTSGAITTWDRLSVLQNDYERVALRLLKDRAPGRVTLDIAVQRGAMHAELTLRTDTSTTLGVYRSTTEAATAGTGYIRATNNDAGGNRYVLGSMRTISTNLTVGGISVSASARLDAFVGISLAGSSAVAGNQPDHLRDQYAVALSETTSVVIR